MEKKCQKRSGQKIYQKYKKFPKNCKIYNKVCYGQKLKKYVEKGNYLIKIRKKNLKNANKFK
jgi:ABC-type phosphate transport system ATPase subunit